MSGTNPSKYNGALRPVETVSWIDAKEFIQKLNLKTEKQFRLPTEAEWEYAARGGQESKNFIFAGGHMLDGIGWYSRSSNFETQDVGQLASNELGLYDMSGNVWEWCEDDWHEDYQGAPSDGRAWVDIPKRTPNRIVRGGCFFNFPGHCRSLNRHSAEHDGHFGSIGFRLVLSLA